MRAILRPDVYTSMFIQIAYYLIEEQQGRTRAPDDYISFVSLLADPSYCGTMSLQHLSFLIMFSTSLSLSLIGKNSLLVGQLFFPVFCIKFVAISSLTICFSA